MNLINSTWGKLSSTTKMLLILVGVVLVTLLLFLYGTRAINGVQSWWFQRGVNQSQKEIQQYKDLAAETLKQLQAEKEVTAAERAKREIAEKILADKSKTTDQKLKAYQDAINSQPVVSPPASTDELCARAKSLGIECSPEP